MRVRVTRGNRATRPGKSHEWLTATSDSRRPRASAISVAPGSSEAMRGRRPDSDGGEIGIDEALPIDDFTWCDRHRLAQHGAGRDEGVKLATLAARIDAGGKAGE